MIINTWIFWIFAVLVYFLIGTGISLCYLFGYKPTEKGTTFWLGLMVILWPFVVIIDFFIPIFLGLGKASTLAAGRIREKLSH